MKLSHDPLQDQEVKQEIDRIFNTVTLETISSVTHQQFDRAWRNWITSSQYHTCLGLSTLPYSGFIPGTTDAFGEFLSRHNHRRIRVSHSDFVLTKILARAWNRDLVELEKTSLSSEDCVIISLPFSGNGSYYPDWQNLLDHAEKLQVPVFLDAAYFGISHGLEFNFNRTCITDVAFSLSKNLAGNPLRLGIRFTRDNIDDGITAGLLGSDIFDRLNAYICIQLLEKFPHAWLINKYLRHSTAICQNNNLATTNTITLALGPNNMTEYKRGDYVRIVISEELSKSIS